MCMYSMWLDGLHPAVSQEDEDKVLKRDGLQEDAGEVIDVTKVAPIPAFCSR